GRSPPPRVQVRRTLRPTPQTRPKPRLLRRRRARHKTAILDFGRTSLTDRPTINSGGPHTSEEPPIIPRIPRQHGSVTNQRIEIHALNIGEAREKVWRFSDLIEKWPGGTFEGSAVEASLQS